MDNEETMVETVDQEPEAISDEEITEDSGEESESLESFVDEGQEQSEAEQEDGDEQGTGKEPGYVQRRIEKAVARERESMRAEILAQIEAQYAPIKERLFEMDAQELVKTGKVKDIETARELVRYRNGQPPKASEESEPARNDKGQFVSREKIVREAQTDARIKELQKQADKIRTKSGVDVIAEFKSNPKIKNAVISGEMDFYDVAEQMKAPKKRSPAPVRSPNGASGNVKPNAIETMSDEQFRKLEKRISEGARYSLK